MSGNISCQWGWNSTSMDKTGHGKMSLLMQICKKIETSLAGMWLWLHTRSHRGTNACTLECTEVQMHAFTCLTLRGGVDAREGQCTCIPAVSRLVSHIQCFASSISHPVVSHIQCLTFSIVSHPVSCIQCLASSVSHPVVSHIQCLTSRSVSHPGVSHIQECLTSRSVSHPVSCIQCLTSSSVLHPVSRIH